MPNIDPSKKLTDKDIDKIVQILTKKTFKHLLNGINSNDKAPISIIVEELERRHCSTSIDNILQIFESFNAKINVYSNTLTRLNNFNNSKIADLKNLGVL